MEPKRKQPGSRYGSIHLRISRQDDGQEIGLSLIWRIADEAAHDALT